MGSSGPTLTLLGPVINLLEPCGEDEGLQRRARCRMAAPTRALRRIDETSEPGEFRIFHDLSLGIVLTATVAALTGNPDYFFARFFWGVTAQAARIARLGGRKSFTRLRVRRLKPLLECFLVASLASKRPYKVVGSGSESEPYEEEEIPSLHWATGTIEGQGCRGER